MTEAVNQVASPAAPTREGERIEVMDALRGFALLGVVIVNMFTFMGPMSRLFARWPSQEWVQFLVLGLVQGKFYSLFSLLFGAGFSLQLERLEARGVPVVALYRRRLAILLLIGLAQGILIWNGDILLPYALLGFVLLAFHHRSDRSLLIGAALLLLFNAGLVLYAATQQGAVDVPDASYQAETTRLYAQGPYVAMFQLRCQQLMENYASTLEGFGPQILAMFLLGAWAGRRGILADPERHRGLLRSLCGWGLGLGLPANAIYALLVVRVGSPAPGHMAPFLVQAFYYVCVPLLTLGLASAFLLASQRVRALGKLAPMGRMALTHYLTHSLIFATLFSFVGLKNYGKVSVLWAPPLAIATWVLQAWVSPHWFKRFRMGPVEWLWRTLTYGKAPAFRSQNL